MVVYSMGCVLSASADSNGVATTEFSPLDEQRRREMERSELLTRHRSGIPPRWQCNSGPHPAITTEKVLAQQGNYGGGVEDSGLATASTSTDGCGSPALMTE